MKAWCILIVGVLISSISGGIAALAVSVVQGNGLLYALLSYPMGGMLAIAGFITLTLRRLTSAQA